jgi:hypothetical protein
VRSMRVQTRRHRMRSVTMNRNIAEAAEQMAHSNCLDQKQPCRASCALAIRCSPSNPIGPDNQYSEVGRAEEFIIRHPPSSLADA